MSDHIDEAIAQLWIAVGRLIEENKELREEVKELKDDTNE